MWKRIQEDQLVEHKRKKKWLDKNTGIWGLTLYPRSLFITWGHSPEYWTWNSFKDTDEDDIEVAKLLTVCWFDVQGSISMSNLSLGSTYEVVFIVKLTKSSSGWEHPINLRLIVPCEAPKIRQMSLLLSPLGEWFELNLGSFQANFNSNNADGRINFHIFERSGQWKNGFIIKSVIIRPKH